MATTMPRIQPMRTTGTRHMIERTHREGGALQWVRETWVNATEAGATRVEYGIEWQAVENLGVYRRVIADNGRGMMAEELVAFFNTFGGGGKPIGGPHENFGIGAKTSLLPWNKCGVVVVSWVDGDPAMIWLQFDETSDEYGLRIMEAEDDDGGLTLETVYQPFTDDEQGCDWSKVKPDWIQEHGTVLVLLGNSPTDNTVLGDPSRPAERDIKGISNYLNRRIWEIPRDTILTVDELRTDDRSQWPNSERMAHTVAAGGDTRRTNRRQIQGARYFIEYPGGKGKLVGSGMVPLTDGTEVEWFLWDGDRPSVHTYAAEGGYIAVRYQNELYDWSNHPASYRSFGIGESTVRARVWLVVKPPLYSDGVAGVYPKGDRNSLLLRGGPNAGGPMPMADWGREFSDLMPRPIEEAIAATRVGHEGVFADDRWRERLAERFGKRWRVVRLRTRPAGPRSVTPTQPGEHPRHRPHKVKRRRHRPNGRPQVTGGTTGGATVGRGQGSQQAEETKVAVAIPDYTTVGAGTIEGNLMAAWLENDPTHPNGVVQLNVEHPVMKEEIEFWQSQFPDHLATDVSWEVIKAYGEIAVAKVAHSESLRGMVTPETIERLRSPEALTMALLGLVAEEAVIATRVGGKFGRRRVAEAGLDS